MQRCINTEDTSAEQLQLSIKPDARPRRQPLSIAPEVTEFPPPPHPAFFLVPCPCLAANRRGTSTSQDYGVRKLCRGLGLRTNRLSVACDACSEPVHVVSCQENLGAWFL